MHQFVNSFCNTMNYFLLSILVVGVVGVWGKGITKKIANGDKANMADFPFQVSIQKPTEDGNWIHLCGGSIIAPEWILTAANCLSEGHIQQHIQLSVLAGVSKLSESAKGQRIKVVQAIPHENHTMGQIPDDIALLHLKSPLEFNDFVNAIALPEKGKEATGTAFVSGWGAIGIITIFQPKFPNELRESRYTIIDSNECVKREGILANPANLICAKSTKLFGIGSVCQGDLGSPFSQNGVVIGITTASKFCGISDSVFTKVEHYLDFINGYINNDNN